LVPGELEALIDRVRRYAQQAGDLLRRLVLDQQVEHLPLLAGEAGEGAASSGRSCCTFTGSGLLGLNRKRNENAWKALPAQQSPERFATARRSSIRRCRSSTSHRAAGIR